MGIVTLFPASWRITVAVERGGGGLDRWGNPLPSEQFEVSDCLLAPSVPNDPERLGSWTDTEGRIYHDSFVFQQNDIVTVPDGLMNAGRWEVISPSAEWPHGTDTRVRRVNQRGVD